VGSLSRPGGNVTGVTFFSNVLAAKRLSLLHDLVPGAATIAVLMNPTNANAEMDLTELQTAARALGLQLQLLRATNEREIDAAFDMAQNPSRALFVAADAYLTSRRNQIIAHVARLRIPATYPRREHVAGGGLISYATQALDANRLAGIYVGRILKGEKPGDLPVQQPAKFELVINLKTAKALSLAIPDKLLTLADEVIE
jgi:putative ABC transport system substrate-binding protein